MINDSKLAEGSQTKPLAEYSDAEPSIRRFPYAGWIPTANGRLSFRHIGESSHPTSSSCTNISVQDSARYILATQVRPLSDVLFQKVSHPLLGLDGNIPFVLTARSYQAPPHDHTIFGRISIFSSKSSWQQRKVDGSPNSKTILKDSITKINDQRQTYSKLDKNLVTQTWKEARSELSSHSEVSVFFKLLRTGEVYFSKPLFTDKVLEDNTIRFADKSGHDFYLWIANQAFFFLRDICHKHQHHDAHSDTILVLQKRSLIDPFEWRRNIVYSLHYHIIRAKRFGNAASLAESLGILAYCSSFERISERTGWTKPHYNNDELQDSVEARLKQIELSDVAQDRASTKNTSRIGIALAILGIVAALLIMLVQPSIEDKSAPPALEKISVILSLLFFPIIAILVIVTFLILVVLWDSPKAGRFGLRRDLLELLNAQPRLSRWMFFVLGLFITISSVYLERSFLRNLLDALSQLVSTANR